MRVKLAIAFQTGIIAILIGPLCMIHVESDKISDFRYLSVDSIGEIGDAVSLGSPQTSSQSTPVAFHTQRLPH